MTPDASPDRQPRESDSPGGSLSDRAYDSIKSLIMERQLRGGEVILEAPLANMLGISRTPLREALQRLEGEGLVVKGAGRSYLVRKVNLAEYLQSVRIREILEPEAAVMATGRVPRDRIQAVRDELDSLGATGTNHSPRHWASDDNVHELLADYCGNEVMARMIRSLRVTTRLFELTGLKTRLELDAVEHRMIVEALELDDVKQVRKAVASHIRSLGRFALQTVR